MKKMRMLKLLLAMMLSTVLQIQMVGADETENSYELEKIIVTDERPDAPSYDATVISEEDVERPTLSGSVVDTLQNSAGVQFMRTSPTSGVNIRLRGFGETRLLIQADGLQINQDGSYGGGTVNWDAISTDQVEKVVIQRGAVSAKYGNTLGGVIDIVSKKPSDTPVTTISSTYGEFETWNTKISHGARAGAFWWTLAGSHFETDGFLRNNYSDRDNANIQVGLALPWDFEIGGGFVYSDMKAGLIVENDPESPYYDSSKPVGSGGSMGGPGSRMQATPGDDSYKDDTGHSVNAFLSRKLKTGSAKLSYRLWNRERTEYYYDIEEPHNKIYERKTQLEDKNWVMLFAVDQKFDRHYVEYGAEHRHSGWGDQTVPYIDMNYFDESDVNRYPYIAEGFKGETDNKKYTALYVMDTWRFHPDWDLELGLRQEWFKAYEVNPDAFGFVWDTEEDVIDVNHLDPRVALTWRPWDGGSLSARYGVAHRYPTSPESFWWYLNKGSQFFNTTLDPEEAVQYELGYEQKLFSKAMLTLRGYYYDIEHYITGTSVRGYGRVVYNIDDVTLKGLETELSVNITKAIRAWANFTWQDGEKSGDHYDTENDLSNQLSNVPDTMYNFGLDYRSDRLMVKLAFNHMGKRDRFEEGEVDTLGSYTRANCYANYTFADGKYGKWQAMAAVDNIFDEDYEEEDGSPMPGISVSGGLKVTF